MQYQGNISSKFPCNSVTFRFGIAGKHCHNFLLLVVVNGSWTNNPVDIILISIRLQIMNIKYEKIPVCYRQMYAGSMSQVGLVQSPEYIIVYL